MEFLCSSAEQCQVRKIFEKVQRLLKDGVMEVNQQSIQLKVLAYAGNSY